MYFGDDVSLEKKKTLSGNSSLMSQVFGRHPTRGDDGPLTGSSEDQMNIRSPFFTPSKTLRNGKKKYWKTHSPEFHRFSQLQISISSLFFSQSCWRKGTMLGISFLHQITGNSASRPHSLRVSTLSWRCPSKTRRSRNPWWAFTEV